jgi:hypothetical protein
MRRATFIHPDAVKTRNNEVLDASFEAFRAEMFQVEVFKVVEPCSGVVG